MSYIALWKKNSGDTIVEVLIALAVISSVLMGAFLVASKSTQGVRNGEEQSEMLQILQGQVEYTRSIALSQTTNTGGIFTLGPFCIDDTDKSTPHRVNASYVACHNIDKLYNVSASFDNSTNVFTFVGTWDALGGGGINREQLNYRIYAGGSNVAADDSEPGSVSGDDHAGGDTGDAYFNNNGSCGGVNQPVCPGPPVNGSYHWNFSFVNWSTNDPSKVLGCTWDWGDNTKPDTFSGSASECQYGGRSLPHDFPVPGSIPPYPALCHGGGKPYNVTLTMRITGVSPDPSWSHKVYVPSCY